MTNDTPKLYGIRERVQAGRHSYEQVRVWCPQCRREHIHGNFGLKTAHCAKGPYRESGYEAVELTGWTLALWAELIKTARKLRTRPRRKK